jgi:hypothetical protein
VVRAIAEQGMEVAGGSRAEFAALIRADGAKWVGVLRRTIIRPE